MPESKLPTLDNTELEDAAHLFARPHCGHCLHSITEAEEAGDRCPHCQVELDADYPSARRETAARLLRVAALAARAKVVNAQGWPELAVRVQAPCDVPMCRVCHCTELEACAGGCSWVEDDLCSSCA